eukprot:SAG11_NODE_5767_length_1467_cov_1.316520_3_plen_69_part_00
MYLFGGRLSIGLCRVLRIAALGTEEPWRRELIEGVLADFEAEVLPRRAELRLGVLQVATAGPFLAHSD